MNGNTDCIETDGIILDIDGTIWNTTEIVAGAWNEAIKEQNFNLPEVKASVLRGEFGKPMNVIAEDLWPDLSLENQQKLLSVCCRKEQLAISRNERNITYNGVVPCIKELSEKCRIFIVSNCQSGYIELVMEKNGIAPYITDSECFGNTGKGKADNLKLVCERNKLQHPVYIGDTQGDADACREAGVPFIWASYGFGKVSEKDFAAKLSAFEDIRKIVCL